MSLDRVPTVNFNDTYDGVPPWDIGKPQPIFVDLEKRGLIKGRVLDIGCGTGENCFFLNLKGHEVWGIDFAPKAIKKAEAKALQQNSSVTFKLHDALNLKALNQSFDCIIDSGLFHVFSDEDRPLFHQSISSVLKARGHFFLLCFSDKELREGGPRRISPSDLQATFEKGWIIHSIADTIFENTLHPGGSQAYIVHLEKLG